MSAERPRGVRLRLGLAAALALALVCLMPLPHGCDARVTSSPEVAVADYQRLVRYANTRTRAEIEAALALVDPQGGLAAHHQLDDQTFTIFPERGAAPVRIALRAEAAAEPLWPRQRIVIDPGHFGGAWSERESRHVVVGDGAPVREGDLTWATARLVADDLVRAGKTVTLTRAGPPAADYPAGADPRFSLEDEAAERLSEQQPNVFPWLTPLSAGRLLWARRQLASETPFALYQRYELRRRAALATAFEADVTLSLHFNTTTNDSNGIVVFVPGNFLPGDFATATLRYWPFVRVLDGTLAETQRLARNLAGAMMRHLQLPALGRERKETSGSYWRMLDRDHGIYARNLAILRRTAGVVLLLEGPCVNQSAEYQR
ncbi:MAG TPA: N-acetylmuramoyl-L-alanine amidase, partial [Polyangia bacterium]